MSSINLDEVYSAELRFRTDLQPITQLAEALDLVIDKEIVMRSWIITSVIAAFLLSFCGIITAQTPSNAVSLYQHGTSKLTKNDLDGAIDDFTKAIELSSRLGPARSINGSKLTNVFTTDTDAANVTVVNPFTAQVYCNRGIARMRKGEYDMAIQDFTQAIRIRPNSTEAYLNRGAAKRAIGDPTGALADTEKALSFKGDLYHAYNNRASIRYDLKDFEGALADLNRAIELNAKIPEPYYNRAYVRVQKRELDGAFEDFNRAIELNDHIAEPYHGRGIVWMMKGKFEEAISDFSHAIELQPTRANSYMNRGLALTVRGRNEEAKKDFDKCLELNPTLKADLEERIAKAKDIRHALIVKN